MGQDKLIQTSHAPGYRYHEFDIEMSDGKTITIKLDRQQSLSLAKDILTTHDMAWHQDTPLDLKPNESKDKPEWVMDYGTRPSYRIEIDYIPPNAPK